LNSNDAAKVFTVSEINKTIKEILHDYKGLKNISIKGELSNISRSGNGHVYFNLKDSSSVIKCAFFSFNYQKQTAKVSLKDGMEILVMGSLNVYEPGGYYSINVTRVEELGQGDIFYKIELLKKSLEAKGIFNEIRKRQIPKYPKRLGIATALGGAAVEDIIRIAKERYENINILIAPCIVQGDAAPMSIVSAIQELNKPEWEVDVIIAGRGGGSIEDLMAFNDERVVMAFYNSRVPIISAVGHQVDSVLSDYSADFASPTPTAAAEYAVPDLLENLDYLNDLGNRLNQSLINKLTNQKERFRLISEKNIFLDPGFMLIDRSRKLDDILDKIQLLGKNFLTKKKSELQKFDKLQLIMKSQLDSHTKKFAILNERIENFSPLGTLKRGYSVVRNKQKKVITSKSDVKKGETLEIILNQGHIQAEVI
jgi:exodeoxyribonuclease VII large subunit